MISKEHYLKILNTPHFSEKSAIEQKKNNTITLKVSKTANKKNIKTSIQNILLAKVKNVRTLVVKGNVIKKGKHIGHSKSWKKAFITLQKGQKLNIPNISE